MKVLVLSKYDRLAASTRHRFVQYGPYLARHGIDLTLSPLFDDTYLQQRFQNGRGTLRSVVAAYLRRVRALLSARRWDLAIVHYELFPYLPGMVERVLSWSRLPYVVDYDDATFHMYDEHRLPTVRRLLGQKLVPTISGARAIMAGSRYLADYAQRFNPRVFVVPTVVDMDRYAVSQPPGSSNGTFTIGWIGSPSTSAYLPLIAPALTRLAAEGPVKLIATGARPMQIPDVDVEVRSWSEQTEVRDLCEADVGVMPLPDEPWARGKCAFKLIQYMAVGLPTVCSPVGANAEVVTPETGLFATGPDEWVTALKALRDDPPLRRRLAAAGHERATAHYSLASQQDKVREILKVAAGR